MNISDAAYHTVHSYPGGSESLAPRIGMSAAVLRNKVNTNNSTHHLSLAEANEIMGVTGDDRILHALAAANGYTLQRNEAPTTRSIICALLAASGAKGDLAELVAEALADQNITQNEASRIGQQCAKIQALLADIAKHAEIAAGRAA